MIKGSEGLELFYQLYCIFDRLELLTEVIFIPIEIFTTDYALSMIFKYNLFKLEDIIRGEPERALNTRGTGSGFICIYIYIYLYVCLWGDHFSEERVKF